MSNLNNNTTQLELLLTKVNALPEAGGSGSVEDIDTCNVVINTHHLAPGVEMKIIGYSVLGMVNKKIDRISVYPQAVSIDSVTLSNVLCESPIVIITNNADMPSSSKANGADFFTYVGNWQGTEGVLYVFNITAGAGEIVEITLY